MSHIKYVSPSGWDWDRPIAVPIKYSSRGLIGADRQEFIKTAGHAFLPQIDDIKVAADEIPVHLIALGAYEAYGANRNGDGFMEKTCRDHHPTFVKFARFFRNHQNKPEKGHPHFGLVKASAYNDAMRRVELLVALNAEKSAADRNGGYVADVELEKLARDGDLPVSMACRVPYDVCTWCGNKARTRKDYCTKSACDAGGCRENLTRVVKVANDMHHLGVLNPSPTWFDISRVFRPADRIAFGAKADYLTKAAADRGFMELGDAIKFAEDDTAPLAVVMYQDGLPGEWNTRVVSQTKLAYALAAVERQEADTDQTVYRAFANVEPFPVDILGEPGTEKCAESLGALADEKIILNLRDFARLTDRSDHYKQAADQMPGIYGRLVESGEIERDIQNNPYPLSEKVASVDVRNAARSGREAYSLATDDVSRRVTLSGIRQHPDPNPKSGFEKVASDISPEAGALARDYATYKVAALERIARSDNDLPLTARLSIRQNLVV